MPDYNLTNTAADIDKALQDSVDLVSPLAASTNSTTAYGDDGNGVSAAEAAVAIKGAKDGNIGINVQSGSSLVDFDSLIVSGFFFGSSTSLTSTNYGMSVLANTGTQGLQIAARDSVYSIRSDINNNFDEIWTSGNTTVDGSGFIKQASPIIKLFADRIEKNSLVADAVSMVKNSVGNYTITGSRGFAQSGWYIEQPKDANGQTKHFIEYQQDQDGTIHIQVYQPVYTNAGISKGDPCDVVAGRWIDIRLHKELDNTGE